MNACALPLLAGGPPGWVLFGIVSVVTLGVGAIVVANSIDNADTSADSGTQSGTKEGTCENCKKDKDPCKGLRDQLDAHRRKLEDYKNNPYAHDNKGFLGQGRDAVIIASRIASLEKQIREFAKQLAECEKQNGL